MSNFRRSRLGKKILVAVFTLMIAGFVALVFLGSWQLLQLLRSPELGVMGGALQKLIERLPALVFNGAFLGIFITSFGVLLQALYLAGDMDFLLATPTPIRAVFVAKLLQAVLPNFGLICLAALPVLFGLGASNNYTLLYYPALILVLACIALAAAGVAALLVMLVVRIFPARRIAEVLGFLGAIISFLCSQSGQLARFDRISEDQAGTALALLERADMIWSPLTWAADGVSALGKGNWPLGIGLTALAIFLCGGLFAVSLVTAEGWYYSGWAGMQSNARKRRPPRSGARTAAAAAAASWTARTARRLLPLPVLGMIGKDWIMMRRDLRNLSQLVTPLILGIVYAIVVFRGNQSPEPAPNASPLLASLMARAQTYTSVGLSLFVSWMLLGRLAGMGFGQEGRSFWVLKTAPIGPMQMIAAKYLVAYLPTLAISAAYLLVIWLLRGAPLSALFYSLLVIALCIAGNAGISLAFGIAGANLEWEDPRQMQRAAAGCLGALASMLYLPLTLALFFGPAILLPAFGASEALGQGIGLFAGGLLCGASAIGPLTLIQKRVARLGEG